MDEKKKKGNGFFKKLLKGIGWFLLVIVMVAGIGALGAWMTGRFDPEKIYIQSLSINGVKEYVTITENDTSYTTKVDFAPENANQLTLTAKIITGADLIEPITNVVAGQPLELKFVKDEHGITKGGEVEIKFIDSVQQAFTTLKVLIDVGLDSQHIEVKSNGGELSVDQDPNVLSTKVLTTVLEENANTIKISADYDEMLNSYKGNWSPSDNNNVVNLSALKKMILHYDSNISVNSFSVTEVLGEENYYLIKYLTPATIEKFEVDVYLYRTYFMEKVFELDFAESLITAYENSDYGRNSFDYDKLNSFINSYVYNSSSVDVKNNYDTFNENGIIVMAPSKYTEKNKEKFINAIKNTLDFALVHKKILISVENIEVTNIVNLNYNSELKLPVLTTNTYDIAKVNQDLGISLEGVDDTVDKQVLFNTLRDMDIVLCYETTLANYTDKLETAKNTGNAEMLKEVNNHYKVGATYLEKASGDKISINKVMNDDGSATWTIKALSPTPNDQYYLVYEYSNNEYDKIQTISNKTYRYETRGGVEAWYENSTLVTDLDTLNTLFKKENSCTEIFITYTKGSIQYNTTQKDEKYVVNNMGSTTMVLNDLNTVYYNDENYKPKIAYHGDNGSVYYKSRDFSVGIRTKENELMTQNVIIRAEDLASSLEYTEVRWFVNYYDNIIDEGQEKTFANNNKYYFKPVVNKYYESNGNINEIPKPYKLKSLDGNEFLGVDASGDYFMEVGNNNFTLEALNAMEDEVSITLYAVIVQTNIDGTLYIDSETVNNGVTCSTLNYISQANDHKISSTQFIEKLNFYIRDGSSFINSTTASNNNTNQNFVDIPKGSTITEDLFITNFLFENGSWWVDGKTSNWLDKNNVIVMQNAINVERNGRIALKRFFDDFIKNKSSSWTPIRYNTDPEFNYGTITPTIVLPTNYDIDDNNYLAINIENNNSSIESGTPYPFAINFQTINNNLKSMFFTDTEAIGYFNLVQ